MERGSSELSAMGDGRRQRDAPALFASAIHRRAGGRSASQPHRRRVVFLSARPFASRREAAFVFMRPRRWDMLVVKAGGRVSTGTEPDLLEIRAKTIHARCPLVIGSVEDVEEYEQFFERADAAGAVARVIERAGAVIGHNNEVGRKGKTNATRNDRFGTNGRKHGAPFDAPWS